MEIQLIKLILVWGLIAISYILVAFGFYALGRIVQAKEDGKIKTLRK